MFPADQRRRLEASLPPNARVVVVDAGHTIHRDRFDEWMRIVGAWLDAP